MGRWNRWLAGSRVTQAQQAMICPLIAAVAFSTQQERNAHSCQGKHMSAEQTVNEIKWALRPQLVKERTVIKVLD